MRRKPGMIQKKKMEILVAQYTKIPNDIVFSLRGAVGLLPNY
jgi:hypothetical protein